MQLIRYLSEIKRQVLHGKSTVIFSGPQFPLLFFSLFLRRLKTTFDYDVHIIDQTNFSYDNFVSQTSISFLGQLSLFWLGDLQALDAKNRNKVIQYCATYQGPHTLLLFVQDPAVFKVKQNSIEVPQFVTFGMYVEAAQWLYPDYSHWNKGFSQRAFKLHPKLPLDSSCLLMHYQQVLGSQVDVFFDEWFESIIKPESSLFMLSSAFFASDAAAFFSLWVVIKDVYPLQFWLSFWSDQLFRAFSFIRYKKAKQLLQSKKIAYRLPFSFIQRDWNSINVSDLQKIHAQLYTLDYRYKHGVSESHLDYILSSYFKRIH